MRNRILIFPAIVFAAAANLSIAFAQDPPPPKGFEKVDTTIVLETLAGKMKYSHDQFAVKPGARVKLILDNKDELQHNWLLCKRGKGNGLKVAKAAEKLGEQGFAKAWIPDDKRILAASGMVDPHKKGVVYFKAPKKEGDYDYVCTFPGHYTLMKGVMTVSRSANILRDLTYVVYKGGWSKLPDFSQLKPEATDHVGSGLFDIGVTKHRENFALVFDGIIAVPKDGKYTFTIASDDGSRLLIDDKVVISHDGVHGITAKNEAVQLTAGDHRIRYECFERSGEQQLYVGWAGPGFKHQSLSKSNTARSGRAGPSGMLLASENGEAKVYRNFIAKGGTRAIGVGYPGDVNLAFNADTMNVSLMWKGDFIDAARHWSGRGSGFQPPAGDDVISGPSGEPLALLDSPNAPWPKASARSKNCRFEGYRLDAKRFPTFHYAFGEISVADKPAPIAGDPADGFTRTLEFKGVPGKSLYHLAAAGSEIRKEGDSFVVDDSLTLDVEGGKAFVLPVDGKSELRVAIPGDSKISIRYAW